MEKIAILYDEGTQFLQVILKRIIKPIDYSDNQYNFLFLSKASNI